MILRAAKMLAEDTDTTVAPIRRELHALGLLCVLVEDNEVANFMSGCLERLHAALEPTTTPKPKPVQAPTQPQNRSKIFIRATSGRCLAIIYQKMAGGCTINLQGYAQQRDSIEEGAYALAAQGRLADVRDVTYTKASGDAAMLLASAKACGTP